MSGGFHPDVATFAAHAASVAVGPLVLRGLGGCGRRAKALLPIRDPSLRQVVWAHLDRDRVAGEDPDPELTHLAREIGDDLLVIGQLHPEHRVRKGFGDHCVHRKLVILLGHAVGSAPAAARIWAAAVSGGMIRLG